MIDQGENCCGCGACGKACPVSAIVMEANGQGFLYPRVDTQKCVRCGACDRVCPVQIDLAGSEAAPEIYAVQHRSGEVLSASSSGGTVSAVWEAVLERSGIVWGAVFDGAFRVVHHRATDRDSAVRFRGSKYVQSDFRPVFDHILEDLGAGVPVLVTGTPCQISALTRFLAEKKADTANLYTIDHICHGVSSPSVWQDYLQCVRDRFVPEGDVITGINMRSKRVSWDKQKLDIRTGTKDIFPQITGFSYNDFYHSLVANRPSCFACRYTGWQRPSDLTVGDLWNKAALTFPPDGGVSEVLVNTGKGRELFSFVRERCVCQAIGKESAWQAHLQYSAKPSSRQSAFWSDVAGNGGHASASVFEKYAKGSVLTAMIRRVSPVLRKLGLYQLAGQLYKKVFVRDQKK